MRRTFPEVLPDDRGGEEWQVSQTFLGDLHATTDLKRKTMTIPGGDDAQSLAVRAREMIAAAIGSGWDHYKVSQKYDLKVASVALAERIRVNWSIRNADSLIGSVPPMAQEALTQYEHSTITQNELDVAVAQWQKAYRKEPKDTLKRWAMAAMDAAFTADQCAIIELGRRMIGDVPEDDESSMVDQIFEQLCERINKICIDGASRQRSGIPKLSTIVELAKALEKTVDNAIDDSMMSGARDGPPADPDDRMRMSKKDRAALDMLDPDGNKMKKRNEQFEGRWPVSAKHRWGELTIVEASLVDDFRIRRLLRKAYATDAGVQIGALHRLYTDQKIFRDVKLVNVGTVLIDTSGSMSLSQEDIYNMVLECPAITVATYSGEEAEGVLKIVVSGGKIAHDSNDFYPPGGGGNIVDGPALEWLGTQQAPRIWISDGCVTGINDTMAPNLTMECIALLAQHQIWRVPTLTHGGQLVKLLNDPRKKRLLMESQWGLFIPQEGAHR